MSIAQYLPAKILFLHLYVYLLFLCSIPPPSVPPPSIYRLVIGDAFIIAIVSFAISISLVKIFAAKHNYDVDSSAVS